MIRKQDVLDRAAEWRLRPDVVEKDYVLGWLLAAISQNAEASRDWVFKGGTCLKKCFFETFRFSEDLDFTLLPGARYSPRELGKTLEGIVEVAADLSGISFPSSRAEIRDTRDKLGCPTFRASVAYRGRWARLTNLASCLT